MLLMDICLPGTKGTRIQEARSWGAVEGSPEPETPKTPGLDVLLCGSVPKNPPGGSSVPPKRPLLPSSAYSGEGKPPKLRKTPFQRKIKGQETSLQEPSPCPLPVTALGSGRHDPITSHGGMRV